jgi:hypothetical protein
MGDQQRNSDKDPSFSLEESAIIAARKAKKYIINREILAKLKKKREEQRRRARKFVLNSELLETNGRPGRGSKIIDLSMNGARLELPFSPPFMSQMEFKFSLGGPEKIFKVVGRVLWSRMTLQRGWYEVGIQFYQNYWEIDQLLRLEPR